MELNQGWRLICILIGTLVSLISAKSDDQATSPHLIAFTRRQTGFELDSMASSYEEEIVSHSYLLEEGRNPFVSLSENDSLCDNFDEQTDECRIVHRQLRFTHDVFYATNSSMVIDASNVRCLTTSYTPCSIVIHLTGGYSKYLELKNGATIQGKQVIINATDSAVRIMKGSSISTSGQSISINGTATLSESLGASFIAQGGGYNCNMTDHQKQERLEAPTYGEFDMMPNKELLIKPNSQMGSCGQRSIIETAGGGRIIVLADNLMLQGPEQKLNANGRPYEDAERKDYSLSGGSGGYIYVKTSNFVRKNNIDFQSVISAQGGLGMGEYGGGSGGVVVFDDQFALSSNQVKVNGGVGDRNTTGEFCINGGAGTIYKVFNDTLVINNKELNTTSQTMIKVPPKKPLVNDKHQLAAKLYVIDGSQVKVVNRDIKDFTFEELYVWAFSRLQVSQNNERTHLHITNITMVSKTSTLDFSLTEFVGIYPDENSTDITLGNVEYREFFGIEGQNVNLIGEINVAPLVKPTYHPVSKVVIGAANITFFGTAQVKAGYTLLHANETLLMLDGSRVESLRSNTCNENKRSKDLFRCIERNSLLQNLTSDVLSSSFQKQFPRSQKLATFNSVLVGLMHNYTAYLFSYNELSLFGAVVKGPRLGLCASNVTLVDTEIDTSGQGCLSDQGLGRGRQHNRCGGSGGANGGIGGYGGIVVAQGEAVNSATECSGHSSDLFAKPDATNYEGSGGASGAQSSDTGGAGGGIVRLSVLESLVMERSQILANGLPGLLSGLGSASGGGAGGSIEIITKTLRGESKIEARGGDGSEGGGGGGSGGRIVMSYLRGYSAAVQPLQSHFWKGSHILNGGLQGMSLSANGESFIQGQAGQNGIAVAGKCIGGYSGPFCTPCPTGTYKFDYSYSECLPCQNKPRHNSFYTGQAASQQFCPYECEEGLDPSSYNPLCHNALQLALERTDTVWSTLFITASILALISVLWTFLMVHGRLSSQSVKKINKNIYEGVLFNVDLDISNNVRLLGSNELQMRDEEIWCHEHRMYLIGDNSINFPWYLSNDFTARSLEPEDRSKLMDFVNDRQSVFTWTAFQKDIYFASCLVCMPLSDLMHRCIRKRHFKALQTAIHAHFPSNFWDANMHEGKRLRVSSSSSDYQLAYVDFLDYKERDRRDYIGPQLPVTLILAGRGTYNSPFRLNFESDPVAKSIVYFNVQTLRDHLPLFFSNLNTLLARLSFDSLPGRLLHDLGEVLDWIELGNKTLFNPLDTKATLFLFQNVYTDQALEGNYGEFKQERRSYPMESVVFESLPEVFRALVDYIQKENFLGKSEFRIGIVFRPFELEQKQQLMDRIRRIMARNKTNLNELSTRKSQAKHLIFSEESDSGNQEIEQSIFAQNSITSGTLSGNVLDGSKRAFEISYKSTHDFEMSLLQARTTCYSRIIRLMQNLCSFWNFLFRYHGLPPQQGTHQSLFIIFAAAMTIDLMLTFIICVHIFHPISNFTAVGIPFLCLMPLSSIMGPLLGTLACLVGSTSLLKRQSAFNQSAVILNYPLTLMSLLNQQADPFYVAVLILLIVNKILIAHTSSRVLLYLQNPGFAKNQEKIQDRFRSLLQVQNDTKSTHSSMSVEERASSFASQGLPKINDNSQKYPLADNANSSDEDDDEDETSFGIIPKNRLLNGSTRLGLSQF